MAQSTITNFFSNRKRPALDELKGKTKVMALDSAIADSGYCVSKTAQSSNKSSNRIKKEAIVFSNDEVSKPKSQGVPATSRSKSRTLSTPTRRATKAKDTKQADMKSFLQVKPEVSGPSAPENSVTANVTLLMNESGGEGFKSPAVDSVEVKGECLTLDKVVEEPAKEIPAEGEAGQSTVEVEPKTEVLDVLAEASSDKTNDKEDHVNSSNVSIMVTAANDSQNASSKGDNSKSTHSTDRKESSIERARKVSKQIHS